LSKGQSPICKKYPAVARKKARVLALIDGALIGLCARRPAKPEWSSYKGISPKLWVGLVYYRQGGLARVLALNALKTLCLAILCFAHSHA
jgi:hypothetical protein